MSTNTESWDPPTAGGGDKKWPQHPEGAYPFILVDAFRLGERVTEWQGQKKLQERVVQVFWSAEEDPDTGKPYELAVELTYSASERATLPKFLSAWLGKKAATDEERGALVADLPSYVGKSGIGTVVHKAAGDRTYVNLTAMAPLMKGMTPLTMPTDYQRNPYWAKKKARYAEEVAAYRKEQADRERAAKEQAAAKAPKPKADFSDVPPAVAKEEDDLPFDVGQSQEVGDLPAGREGFTGRTLLW